jgi:hypothetical protein
MSFASALKFSGSNGVGQKSSEYLVQGRIESFILNMLQ